MFSLRTTPALALASLLVAGQADAGVVAVPDALDQGPGVNIANPLGVTISGDPAVYLLGTMTIDDVALLDNAYTEANMGLGTAFKTGFGNAFGNDSIVIARDGTRATATSVFESGVPTTLLIKFDQVTGETSLWVNPDLGTTEAANTPEATATLTEANSVQGQDYDSVIFRGGDFTPTPDGEPPVAKRRVDYTDFAVYYGGDSPFVPEPTSLALLGMGGLLLARRRRA